jgi:hypothetical protein
MLPIPSTANPIQAIDLDRRRHVAELTFCSKGDAQTHLDTVSADLHRGLSTDPTDGEITVADLADLWMAANPSKRAATLATDQIALRVHILPTLGDKQIAKVKPPHIDAVVSQWGRARRSPNGETPAWHRAGHLRRCRAVRLDQPHAVDPLPQICRV